MSTNDNNYCSVPRKAIVIIGIQGKNEKFNKGRHVYGTSNFVNDTMQARKMCPQLTSSFESLLTATRHIFFLHTDNIFSLCFCNARSTIAFPR
jgi:hypothetical protein